ncbi:uncharacterized protein BJ171DRAFT_565392 [Polychytrium aggregatum]|uniref:uncharacterized protein n=1 Tax=Polychytrium aggregatum TaxID=110093 RepID=UPI0022FE643D|nr:uncharacterized protein BJ171DRAFT_565392 [Polychytrium aggregatum]KAI9208252.1 hypothetical protein BJ171DRAFT_565392 [Polychytrium aggregatum]
MSANAHPSIGPTQPSPRPCPDIFTIICCNDSFQLALSLADIETLLLVCKRAQPLLDSKVNRLRHWCKENRLHSPDRPLPDLISANDLIAISLHYGGQETADRSWLVALADQGNPAASYLLARILQANLAHRQPVTRSKRRETQQEIAQHLETAANAKHPMAQFHLAHSYRNGLGVFQDYTKAVELYRTLADRGMPQAQIALGCCYEGGESVDQDFDTAIEWHSKAADQGSEDGRLHIVFFRGWLSFIGHGVKQSDADAFNRWQEVSTQSTDPVIKPIATHMVGWMHYLGRGTVRDEQKGVKIIRENRSDEFPLGEEECLAGESTNVRPDSSILASRKFVELCQLGSEQDWLCRHLTAVCLVHGVGVPEDQVTAAGIFEQLANDGHNDSQVQLRTMYFYGRGVEPNLTKAFQWCQQAADQNNSFGQWMLGTCYRRDDPIFKDLIKAAQWFHKSAEQCNRYGQDSLGYCYRSGEGVARNLHTSRFWFNKAEDQGIHHAWHRVKVVHRDSNTRNKRVCRIQ